MNLESIREAMAQDDAEIRRRALLLLSASTEPGAISLILGALGDTDWRVRKQAVELASGLPSNTVASALFSAVSQGDNVGLRNAALEVLGTIGEHDSRVLIRGLKEVAPHARKFLMDVLKSSAGPEALALVNDALDSDDPNLVVSAMNALARIGGAAAERALLQRVLTDDSFQQMAALDALDRLGVAVPWAVLEPLTANPLTRRLAVALAARTDDPRAVPVLIAALQDDVIDVAAHAAISLGHLITSVDRGSVLRQTLRSGGDRIERVLTTLTDDARSQVQNAAITLLALSGVERAMDLAVQRALTEELDDTLLRALAGLGGVGVARLGALIRKAAPDERAAMLDVLAAVANRMPLDAEQGQATAEMLAETFRAALRDPSASVVSTVLQRVRIWGAPRDATTLVSLLEHDDPRVALAAGVALSDIAGRFSGSLQPLWATIKVMGAASGPVARLLVQERGEEALPQLQAALSVSDARVRRAAVDALGDLGAVQTTDLIVFALADESMDVRAAAAVALGNLRYERLPDRVTTALLLALDSDAPPVQAAAAEALGRLGCATAIPPLKEAIRRKTPVVVLAALSALESCGDADIEDTLVETLGHDDEEVVKQCLRLIYKRAASRTTARLSLALEHRAWDVRSLASRLLGDTGDPSARAPLQDRLAREDDDLVRASIEESLAKLQGDG
jgi:HEAT repeat protein